MVEVTTGTRPGAPQTPELVIPLNRAGEPMVLSERIGHVAVVRINRPEVRNAASSDLRRALKATFLANDLEDDVWVHIVTGVGTTFCVGSDLKERSSQLDSGALQARAKNDNGSLRTIGYGGVGPWLSKPIIAAVNGLALGGGCEICLACDLIVMEEQAEMGLPEVRRGLVAGAGGLERLPRRIPPALAMEAILTGRPISAGRAYEIGLVNAVVPTGGALPAALDLAADICLGAPPAVRYSLQVVRAASSTEDHETVESTASARTAWLASDDLREGPKAFSEKRTPRWTGH